MLNLNALSSAYLHHLVAVGDIQVDTARNERAALRSFIACCDSDDPATIGRDHAEQWLSSIRHLAPGTRRNYFGYTYRFCSWLVDTDQLAKHPMAGLRPPKVPKGIHRAFDQTACSALMSVCHDTRDQVLVILGLQQGLRRAEIARLELGDINLAAATLDVVGKAGHQRRIPLTEEARALIAMYLRATPLTAGPLLRLDRHPGRGVSADWVGRRFRKLAFESGVKIRTRDGISTHCLRHTAASDIYTSSRDVLAVADMLGHSNLSNTQRYVRGLDVERLRSVVGGRTYARTLP